MSDDEVIFEPYADLDPNVWYHLSEERIDDPTSAEDLEGMLVVADQGNGSLAVLPPGGDHWQFQPVETESQNARYAVRSSSTDVRKQLSVCYREDEIANGKTQPCMADSDGSDEQKWDIARWNYTLSFRLINVANGSDYWMDCHPGNPPFMSSNIDTEVYQPGQRWIISSAGVVDDGAFSTTFSTTPTATATDDTDPGTSGPAIGGPGDGKTEDGLSSGAVAGVGVGAALVAIALAVVLFYFWRRRRRNAAIATAGSQPPTSMTISPMTEQDKTQSFQQQPSWNGAFGYAQQHHRNEHHEAAYPELPHQMAPSELPAENTSPYDVGAGR